MTASAPTVNATLLASLAARARAVRAATVRMAHDGKTPARRVGALGGRHLGGALLPRDARRPRRRVRGRRRLHLEQGARLHVVLRDPRRARRLPGVAARELRAERWGAPRAPDARAHPRGPGRDRLARPRARDRRRHGARARPRRPPRTRLHVAERRRVQRGQRLGGGDVRRRSPPRQPRSRSSTTTSSRRWAAPTR